MNTIIEIFEKINKINKIKQIIKKIIAFFVFIGLMVMVLPMLYDRYEQYSVKSNLESDGYTCVSKPTSILPGERRGDNGSVFYFCNKGADRVIIGFKGVIINKDKRNKKQIHSNTTEKR